ncbi:hypothetical protein F5Y17DRAFT_425638 [Xylariaceae sp. FL0594]|nr:hypothetical protein F5Y17DRAFT_425638 [Xylariaceae sp. FL0594]
MSHPQSAFVQRQFQQPQGTSPAPSPLNVPMSNTPTPTPTPTPGFAQPPPSKRARMSPGPVHSQPNSPLPYAHSNYAPSPPSGAPTPTATAPPTNLPSPSLPPSAAPVINPPTPQMNQGQYNMPQPTGQLNGNGRHLSVPAMQASQIARTQSPIPSPQPIIPSPMQPSQIARTQSPIPSPQPMIQTPIQPMTQYQRPSTQPPTPGPNSPSTFSNAMLVPASAVASFSTSGNMGPPAIHPTPNTLANEARQKPASSTKDPNYDVNDMLMGTGIDLDEEAEFMNNLETRTGFPHLPAQGKDSFYGAGPANQPPEAIGPESQEEYAAMLADRTWNEAAHRLAVTRSQEIRHHLLEPGILHKRISDVAQKFGLGLNLELRPDGRQFMGRLANPADAPKPELIVSYKKAPDGTVVNTCGSFIPKEAYLVDQIALLSLGTKERLRDLLSDANKLALARQKSSHGAIPPAWADVAAPAPPSMNGTQVNGARTGAESAVSPRTNPLKRPVDEISNGLPTPISEAPPPNYLVDTLIAVGKEAQSVEEGRLRKRQKRLEKSAEKDKDGTEGGSRSGSVAPGTPGSIAPDGDGKALTKKEGKKAAAKALDSGSGTTVNATLSLFTGGKKKKYSWMTSGAGSGASTPRPQANSGANGGPGGPPTRTGRGPLTRGSVTHLGQFREDSVKGKHIQLRDWIIVLEDRGMDARSLQAAYVKVDKSDTGDKVVVAMEKP